MTEDALTIWLGENGEGGQVVSGIVLLFAVDVDMIELELIPVETEWDRWSGTA